MTYIAGTYALARGIEARYKFDPMQRLCLVISLLCVFVVSCQSGGGTNVTGSTADSSSRLLCDDSGVVTITTSDGIELAADYQAPAASDLGGVVLLHMIPPNFDRSSYPQRVRDALHQKGVAVLNIDRRGAGGSGGVAADAYRGPLGKLDVEAAVTFLTSADRQCPTLAGDILLVGASNGTTSVMDYTVDAQTSALPLPKAIAWLSPGTYTESQNSISANQQLLQTLPNLIVHPDNEPWAQQYSSFSSNWKIVRIDNGQHGTQNFDNGGLEQIQLGELTQWIDQHVTTAP